MKYSPKDPNYVQRVEESFHRQDFMSLLGAKLRSIEVGSCEIEVPYSKSLSQQHGFFHAGVVGTIADTAAGYAAYSLMESTSSILTVEFKLNLLAPADGELLISKASVLKYGRTLTVCRSDVFIVKNGREKMCAAAQLTLIELKDQKDS